MGHGLALESRIELTKGDVGNPCGHQKGQHPEHEMPVPEQEYIPQGAHGAEPAALGQKADPQPDECR
jgi:hypothetical protein